MPSTLENPELTADSEACWVVKDEVVSVEFAVAAGRLESAVGLNRYAAGDALLTGSFAPVGRNIECPTPARYQRRRDVDRCECSSGRVGSLKAT